MASATSTSALAHGRIPMRLQRLRAVPAAAWAKLALAAMCLLALVGYFAFPTYPTYDSFYALLWGRDLLHLHLPDFSVYRGPTEHPLAIAFGAFCSIFGQYGARLVVLGSILSFVALVAGSYRLARLCFGPLVGVVAGLLVLSRFFVENLAAQGYLDITYVALVVWAVSLEVERPRRGAPVLWLLAAAGLLRPEAWVLSGFYWLWLAWPAGRPRGAARHARSENRMLLPVPSCVRYLAIVLSAPLVWIALDAIVTGDPLFSLHSTSGLAAELERTKGFSAVLSSTWSYAVRIDKLPVLIGGLLGIPLALWLTPRRALVPLAALACLLFVYVAQGAAGASVVDRYMVGSATVLLVFCALVIGGWSMLRPGWLRRVWIAGAVVLVAYGTVEVARTLNLSSLRNTLAYHEDFHEGLVAALHTPAVSAPLARCRLLSLPDNKLIPDARWILGGYGQRDVLARSQAAADRRAGEPALQRRLRRGSVAVYPLGAAVFFKAIVDPGDDPRVQAPEAGFKRVYTSRYYAVYANC
ncbi:MAG TPA: hypothetical protein VHU13_05675 [Solirubrobacteraceae bacterium]|jgi:hypothetical protein|nr:hypothetical protein [Solirubrobacteraceae bacterium]